MRDKIKFIYQKGLVHIMGSGLLNKVFTFIGNVFVVRFLTKREYGIFGYADNIMTFFLILNGMGIIYGMLQFCSEQRPEEEKEAYYWFSLKFGMAFNFAIAIGVFICAMFAPLKVAEARHVLMIYSLYPLTYYIYQYYCLLMRCKRENKRYALLSNLNAFIYMAVEIVGAYYLKASGIIIALYLATVITSLVGMRFYSIRTLRNANYLSKHQKLELIKYSAYVCANTMISNLLILMDVFLIGYIIVSPEKIAIYKVAATIPEALIVIPNSVVIFVYPYFAEHNMEYGWIKQNTKRLIGITAIMNFIIAGMLFVLAPWIIKLLWGAKYMGAVTAFRILSVNYFVSSTLRVNVSNLLASLRKVKLNFYINIVAGISNIVLDAVLIKYMGIDGAAWATLTVVIITTAMLMPALIHSIRCLKKIEPENS